MRKLLILMLSIALIMSLSSFVGAATELKLGHDHAVGSIPAQSAEKFAELVSEKTDGNIKIEVYPAGQLGNGNSIIEGVMEESTDLTFVGGTWYANFDKDYMVTSFPFAFNDKDHFIKFLESEKHKDIMKKLEEEKNLKYLAYHAIRLPRMLLTQEPAFSPEDIEDKKMRVPAVRVFEKGWSAMGANPTQVDWGEVYLAAKQGIVEVAEGPFDSLYDAKFHEVFPYFTWTKHVYTFMPFTMNANKFDSFSSEEQEILVESAEEASDYFNDLGVEFTEKYRQKMMEEGVTFIHTDTTSFKEKLEGVPEDLESDGLWSEGLYEYIQELEN